MTTGVIRAITLDVADLERAEAFWTGLLGLTVLERSDQYSWLSEVAPGLKLVLQWSTEPKNAKNRVHLDLDGPDPAALIDRARALGAGHLADVDENDYAFTVLSDPDGNEFCVSRRMSEALSRRDVP